jgi:hypothetical protein
MIAARPSNEVLVTFGDTSTTHARLMWMPDGPRGLGQLDASGRDRLRFADGASFTIGPRDLTALTQRCLVDSWEPLPRGGRSIVRFRRRVPGNS